MPEDHCYLAYGLNIQSSLALPALMKADGTPDVIIRFDRINFPSNSPTSEDGFSILALPEGVYLYWQDVGKFLVRGGKEILIEPRDGVTDEVLQLFTIGTTLAILLYQRKLTVLHASAVAVDGGAVVFVGDKGYGKSTTAAALYARGHRLVADDLVAIDLEDSSAPRVIPGYPMFKLWPESVESLGWGEESLPRLREDLDKLGRDARDSFIADPLPLRCIYVLGGGERLYVEPFDGHAAFFHALSGLYISRFPAAFNDALTAANNFRHVTNLIRHVPVRGLLRPQDLSNLPKLAAFIEHDLSVQNSPPGFSLYA
jgi:hypothetical protein